MINLSLFHQIGILLVFIPILVYPFYHTPLTDSVWIIGLVIVTLTYRERVLHNLGILLAALACIGMYKLNMHIPTPYPLVSLALNVFMWLFIIATMLMLPSLVIALIPQVNRNSPKK